jgi:RNA polymerase sigma factor (TIGR02999 family)
LLARARSGSREAQEALLERVHAELRKLAASYLRRERPNHTLQPTALVHEAYLRLVPQLDVDWANRAHFFGIAASMMRRVLVDHARNRAAKKRDGLAPAPLTMSNVAAPDDPRKAFLVMDLHKALEELAAINPRQAEVIEKREFAGMTIEELAKEMKIAPATVKRAWSAGMVWLKKRLGGPER